MSKIVLNIVTYNKLHRMWENILQMREYFDEVRIIDGNSTDGTKEFCKLHELTYIPYELKNSIVEGYNKILENGKEDEWLVVCDSDEVFTRVFMRNMRRMIEESKDGKEYNVISTIPLDINADLPIFHSFEKKVELQQLGISLEQAFKKEVMFKWYPELKYEGTNHHNLVGNKKPLYIYYGYYHIRSVEEICESAVHLLSGDILEDDLKFPSQHFYIEEINYLKREFSLYGIDSIPRVHEFFDSKSNMNQEFIDFCKNCFMENGINTNAKDNGEVINPRMAWFIYMFYFKYPELIPENYKNYFDDKQFIKGL